MKRALYLLTLLLTLTGCEEDSIVRNADCYINTLPKMILELNGVSTDQYESTVEDGISNVGYFDYDTSFHTLYDGHCEADHRTSAHVEIWDVYCYHDNRHTPQNPYDDSEIYLECHLLTH